MKLRKRVGGEVRSRASGGVSRPPMTNYYRGEPKSTSPFESKKPKKPLKAALIKIVDWLIVAAALLCLIYSLIIKPDPKIIASNTSYRPLQNYQLAASSDMKSFKDRSKLTFDEVGLATDLKKQFPEIQNVNIELPMFGQQPVIRLSIANPKFVLINQDTRYVVADSGVVVAYADTFADDDNLPVVFDKSGFSAQVGKAVLAANEVSFINQVVLQCQRAKVPIKQLSLPPNGQELDLQTSDKNYYVKFDLAGDPMVEIGQFLAARHQFAVSHIDPSQYLDVRVAGKIFYK